MKKMKRAIIGLFIVLLFINFVYAADVLDSSKDATIDFKGKTNEVLEKEVKIPDNLQIAARILFGLKSTDKVDLQTFIILICIFTIILILMKSIIDLFTSGSGVKSYLIALLITILMGLSGGFKLTTGWLISISHLFGFLEKYAIIRFIIIIVMLLILFFLITKVFKIFKVNAEMERSTQIGENIGFMALISKMYKRRYNKNA